MKQEWKSIKSTKYAFEYPIQDRSDPMVAQVQAWLTLTCGPMNMNSWLAGFLIKPSEQPRVMPFGQQEWTPVLKQHPLWIHVTIDDKAAASMFKVAWC